MTPLLFVPLVACGMAPVGRAYNEAVVSRLPLGATTTAETKAALGAPFQANAVVASEAPSDCPEARELWLYSYTDIKESACSSSLYFDASARLCSRKTATTKRGPACAGGSP